MNQSPVAFHFSINVHIMYLMITSKAMLLIILLVIQLFGE